MTKSFLVQLNPDQVEMITQALGNIPANCVLVPKDKNKQEHEDEFESLYRMFKELPTADNSRGMIHGFCL